MKRFQRTLTTAFAAAALAGSFSLAANAQPAPAPSATTSHAAAHHGQRAKPVDLAQRHADRSERLKTILQLQPNQQAAWAQYVQATTPAHRARAAGERPDLRKLTTPERLDLAQNLRKERTAQAEQREQATRSFYASLSTSQQKAFDTLTVRHAGPHKAGGGAHRMGQRHGHADGHSGHPGHRAPTPVQAAAQAPAA